MAIGRRLGAWVLVALAFPASAQTEVDLEFGDDETEEEAIAVETAYGVFSNGYLRIGVGSTNGGDFTIFKLNGAESKYRLGNESDVYAEFGLGYRAALANGSDFVVEAMVNGFGDSNAFTNGDAFAGDSNLVQAYAGIENIGNGAFREAFIWAGRRYYRRRDVHITDFYYENMSGDAIGVENVRLGPVGLSTAAFYYDADDIDYTSTALDMRVHDIGFRNGWFGEGGAIWIDGSGDDQTGDDGYSIRFHLDNLELGWGEMRNALMYGAGAGIEFNSTGAAFATSDDNRLRFVSQALIRSSEDLESQATLVLQQSTDRGRGPDLGLDRHPAAVQFHRQLGRGGGSRLRLVQRRRRRPVADQADPRPVLQFRAQGLLRPAAVAGLRDLCGMERCRRDHRAGGAGQRHRRNQHRDPARALVVRSRRARSPSRIR